MSERNKPKIGEGHLSAMARLGLKELRAAAYFSESNVAQPPEYGLYGSRTPGEVAEARRIDDRDLEEEPQQGSIVAQCLRQAEGRGAGRERESKGLERE
jgi:hypothetical protein